MATMNDKKSQGGNQRVKQSKQVGDFIIGKTLGEGTFGKVRLGVHKHTNQKVAIKFLQKKKITQVSDAQRITRQIHILKHIRHPNLVQLYQIIQTPKQLLLIMQYMQNGQLFDHIVRNKRIGERQAKRMFHEIIDGIEYVHRIGVAHRDLKPENILLSYNHTLKIVDFGLSNTYKKGEMLKTPCGSPCYAAPEMIQGQRYSGLKVDIWSCGIILFAMLNGYLPFQDQDTNSLYKKILSGTYEFHHSVSSHGRDLIQKILTTNPNQRYTIQQIRNHEWMSLDYQRRRNDGIVVGYNKIPVDPEILNKMKESGGGQVSYDRDYVQTCVEINRHNDATVTYYLTMKKHLKQGGSSKFDLGNQHFDRTFIQPVIRRKQTINTTDILIENFFTKPTTSISNSNNNKSVEMAHGQGRKVSGQGRLSRDKEENKENVGLVGNNNNNRKKSRDNCNVMLKPHRSKDKSKDHMMKLALKQHSVLNTSNMISSTNCRTHSNKLNHSIQKHRQSSQHKHPSQKLTSSSTTSKLASKPSKNLHALTTKLDNSINYGRIPLTKSIQKTSGRQSSSVHTTTTNYRQSIIQNRVTRKYKQQFNQSLISKSRGKLKSQREKERLRVNSTSINNNNNNHSVSHQQQQQQQSYVGFNTASSQMYTNSSGHVLMNLSKKYKDHDNSTCYVQEYLMRGKKLGQKKHCSTAVKQSQTESNKLIKPRKL